MSSKSIYYVYRYNREDGTPYYIGKGKGRRMFEKHVIALPPKDRIIVIAKGLYDNEAKLLERKLIEYYGRKDLGTGILRNLTAGGDGSEGRILSAETKTKISKSLSGNKRIFTKEHRENLSSALIKLDYEGLMPLAKQMRQDGYSYRHIERTLGLNRKTVKRLLETY